MPEQAPMPQEQIPEPDEQMPMPQEQIPEPDEQMPEGQMPQNTTLSDIRCKRIQNMQRGWGKTRQQKKQEKELEKAQKKAQKDAQQAQQKSNNNNKDSSENDTQKDDGYYRPSKNILSASRNWDLDNL